MFNCLLYQELYHAAKIKVKCELTKKTHSQKCTFTESVRKNSHSVRNLVILSG